MNITGIIPARYDSSRFPGKPLADIGGKSMLQRVYEQCKKAKCLNEVLIATDDEKILEHCKEFGGRAVITDKNHPSGTDRCYEAFRNSGEKADVIINIQGDEPFISPDQIEMTAACFEDEATAIATLRKKITETEEIGNESVVKVIADKNGFALYFSRGELPHVSIRERSNAIPFYKHIGIYGYRSEILKKLVSLQPSPLEKAEKLEQLRWMENGYRIKTAVTEEESHSVDRPEDIDKLKSRFRL